MGGERGREGERWGGGKLDWSLTEVFEEGDLLVEIRKLCSNLFFEVAVRFWVAGKVGGKVFV